MAKKPTTKKPARKPSAAEKQAKAFAAALTTAPKPKAPSGPRMRSLADIVVEQQANDARYRALVKPPAKGKR